jgi:phosphoglycolate phosphatase-like HAD superfamily hydrolase
LVFDFDGVLVESVDAKGDAFALLFREFGSDIAERVRQHHLANGGMSRFDKFRFYYRELLGQTLTDAELGHLAARFSELVFERVLKAPFVVGAVEALAYFAEAGLPMYVVSATPQEEVRELVARRSLSNYFHNVFGSPEPKPEALRAILDATRRPATSVAFLGDALADYEAAVQTGVTFIARQVGTLDWQPYGVPVIPDLAVLPDLVRELAISRR